MRKRYPLFTIGVCFLASLSAAAQEWIPLFDGKSLTGWKETAFQGHGSVSFKDGTLVMGAGKPLTGVNWTGTFPKIDYEVRFEAQRVQGGDFFASLTAPFNDSFFTFVTGGWGGDIVGISSIDGWDASDNESRTYVTFENGRWYSFQLRVTADRIVASIDGKQVVNTAIQGRKIGMRHGEIQLSAPFGFASYGTTGALRKIEYRSLPANR